MVNENRPGVKRDINWARARNCESALMQVTGTLVDEPCTCCVRGLGRFEGCVVSDVDGLGACANCHYGGQEIRCSLRSGRHGPGAKIGESSACTAVLCGEGLSNAHYALSSSLNRPT